SELEAQHGRRGQGKGKCHCVSCPEYSTSGPQWESCVRWGTLGGDCAIEESFRFSLHGNRNDHKIEYFEGNTLYSVDLRPMQAVNVPFENPDACGAANWVGMVRSVVDLVECDSSLAIQHLANGKNILLDDPDTTFSNGAIILKTNQELNYYASLRARAASVLSLTLPTCFREFHRARSERGVPG
ncbi:hypothetical protein, partial [Roseinatronobacter ekhonensis]|uniref:hypothetical protein n=1 Tax=Roseinatronobacter ekhonensis TaxID=254356 RepID=UPI001C7CE92A